MGSGVLGDGVIAADSIRRATVFALLFGGAVGLIAWRAGGLRSNAGPNDAARTTSPAPTGASTPIADGVGVGESEDGVLAREFVKVIGGVATRWRAWSAAWAKATPKKSADPAVGVQDLVKPRVVLYPEPQTPAAAPSKAGDAGTTTITSNTGVLSYEKDVRTEAHLDGDVAVDRVDPQRGGFRLRTPSLVCTMETHGDVEKRHAQTAAAVAMDGGRAHIQGTGLDADLTGDACRATIQRDVKGHLDAQPGAVTMTGGSAEANSQPLEVTCSGACELASLDAAPRGEGRRWRATFHDAVHVVQGQDTLDCDLLEIDFKMGETKTDDGMPPQHGVATGHVRIHGATESRTYGVTCAKATHGRQGVVGKEMDVVVFEGSPVFEFFGPLEDASGAIDRTRDPKKKPDPSTARGRMEVRCDGPATMETYRGGSLPTSPHRTSVEFLNHVVVRQWDDEKSAATTGELRAPKAVLFGTRLEGGPFQPDTMTSEGGVDLKRLEFASHSETATWTRVSKTDVDRYMLAGEPVVVWTGVQALHPFGKAKKSPTDSRVTVRAADGITMDVYAERPPVAGEAPRPYATIVAGPRVSAVQTEDGKEVMRATADREARATIAQGKQLEHVEGDGNAHLWGLSDDGETRDLYGARVVLDRLVLPPGAPKDAPHPAQAVALGDPPKSQALATIHEPDGDEDAVWADSLRYAEDGAAVFATGHVVASIDTKARAAKPDSNLSKIVDGPVRITAGEARIDLAPDASKVQGARKLRKLDAGGGVVVDGKIDRIEGKTAVYDGETGIAEVRGPGQTARVTYSAESARWPSYVLADVIRGYFDVSSDPAKSGQLTRVACPVGGRIIRYLDAPDAAPQGQKPGKAPAPRRLQVESKGPMESTRSEANAADDVVAVVWSLAPSGEWTADPMKFYCQRAHLTFDPDAPGEGKDKLRTFDAWGADGRQVVVETPDFFGHADHVALDAKKHVIKLTTDSGPDVYVREIATGRQTLYDSATYDYDTHEWFDTVRAREVEGAGGK